LLEKLGFEIPNLPLYDPTKDEKLPWEDAVAEVIEKLRTEREIQKRTRQLRASRTGKKARHRTGS
jgi:hypothetical protein